MTISRAPKKRDKVTTIGEDRIDQLINKGGSTPKSKPAGEEEAHPLAEDKIRFVQLRIPDSIISRIDDLMLDRNKGLTKMSRHDWLLEAISEKLYKDRKLKVTAK